MKKNNITIGTRFFKYDSNNDLKEIRVVKHVNENLLQCRCTKGEMFEGNRKFLIADLEENYTMLNPDAYVSFHIVEFNSDKTGKAVSDVIVSVHRMRDIRKSINIPYCVCRQNVINTYSEVLMKYEHGYNVGMCMSIDTIPEGVDYKVMTACDRIVESCTIATYIDDNLEDMLGLLFWKFRDRINNILEELFLWHVNSLPESMRSIPMSYQSHAGYCRTLKLLLEENMFMFDYERGFDIVSFNGIDMSNPDMFVCTDGEYTIKSRDVLNKLQYTYSCEIFHPVFIKFDKDVVLKEIHRDYKLIKDKNKNLYVMIYEKGSPLIFKN